MAQSAGHIRYVFVALTLRAKRGKHPMQAVLHGMLTKLHCILRVVIVPSAKGCCATLYIIVPTRMYNSSILFFF